MLSSLLFGEYRQRALGLLLLNPEVSYHVRELERITGTSGGTLHKAYQACCWRNTEKKQIGNQVHYSANRSCPIFDELASILRKTSGLTDVLGKALIALENKIDVAFVFGSVARGDHQTRSDVDMMIIGSLSFAVSVQTLHASEAVLQREINPAVYSQAEFNQRKKKQ